MKIKRIRMIKSMERSDGSKICVWLKLVFVFSHSWDASITSKLNRSCLHIRMKSEENCKADLCGGFIYIEQQQIYSRFELVPTQWKLMSLLKTPGACSFRDLLPAFFQPPILIAKSINGIWRMIKHFLEHQLLLFYLFWKQNLIRCCLKADLIFKYDRIGRRGSKHLI